MACCREAVQNLCFLLQPAGKPRHNFCQLKKGMELFARNFSSSWNSKDKITISWSAEMRKQSPLCDASVVMCNVGRICNIHGDYFSF